MLSPMHSTCVGSGVLKFWSSWFGLGPSGKFKVWTFRETSPLPTTSNGRPLPRELWFNIVLCYIKHQEGRILHLCRCRHRYQHKYDMNFVAAAVVVIHQSRIIRGLHLIRCG
eukprot:5769819-Amphidinium_carterae.1